MNEAHYTVQQGERSPMERRRSSLLQLAASTPTVGAFFEYPDTDYTAEQGNGFQWNLIVRHD